MPQVEPDVLIIGAGPTGLTLAITCRRFGLSVRVVDRAPEPTQVSKALAVWSASLEVLDALGVIDEFLQQGRRMRAMEVGSGRRVLATLPVGVGIDSPYPFPLLLPQSRTEAILTARLERLGVRIERGVEATGVAQDAETATVTLTHRDGRQEQARAAFAVACDGARSAMRRALEIPFEGITEPQTFLLCDARMAGRTLDPTTIHIWWRGGSTVALFPVEGGLWRVFAMRAQGDAPTGNTPAANTSTGNTPTGNAALDGRAAADTPTPATLEELQDHMDRHGPGGLRLTDPTWISTFGINERVAARFRVGRCFLAGDAAHIHSPAGGQGMNTGIQDAFNLGWKLAHIRQGRGEADRLLDSYEAERRPVAQEVVKGATQKLHLAFARSPLLRLARGLAVPVLARVPGMVERLQLELSETAITYEPGPLVPRAAGRPRRTDPGTRARDVSFRTPEAGHASLWHRLAWPGHTLLLFGAATGSPPTGLDPATVQVLALDAAADPDGAARARYGVAAAGWVLIRPDQVVAARGEGSDYAALGAYARAVLNHGEAA